MHQIMGPETLTLCDECILPCSQELGRMGLHALYINCLNEEAELAADLQHTQKTPQLVARKSWEYFMTEMPEVLARFATGSG